MILVIIDYLPVMQLSSPLDIYTLEKLHLTEAVILTDLIEQPVRQWVRTGVRVLSILLPMSRVRKWACKTRSYGRRV